MENRIESKSRDLSFEDQSPKRSLKNSKQKLKPRAYLAVGMLSRQNLPNNDIDEMTCMVSAINPTKHKYQLNSEQLEEMKAEA